MTPPALDAASVHAKLRLMRQLLDDLDGLGEVPRARLEDDRMLRYAVERILTQLVDLAVAVNGHLATARLGEGAADYRGTFALAARAGALDVDLATRLSRSVGLRNLLTHEYAAIDLDVVVRAIPLAGTDYGAYVRSIAQFLAD